MNTILKNDLPPVKSVCCLKVANTDFNVVILFLIACKCQLSHYTKVKVVMSSIFRTDLAVFYQEA
jgi:hypothetical protein